MPNPIRVLACTIGVTIVGPKNKPEKTMLGFLRVRRKVVRDALVWLKEHNPLYTNIVISDERLGSISQNGIPDEILNSMRYSDDVHELERERAGYVPDDFDEENNQTVGHGSVPFMAAGGLVEIEEDVDPELFEHEGQFGCQSIRLKLRTRYW